MAPARRVALLRTVIALAAVGALAAGAPTRALAAGGEEDPALSLELPERIELARVDVVALPASTDPASIEVGVPCGMLEMCGQDQCLCGAVDAWGACACNGVREARPSFSLSCDAEGVVALVEVLGTPYLVALGTGSTEAVVSAELPHHRGASASATVEVAPLGPLDVAKVVGALAVLAAVAALAALAVRRVARAARKAAARLWERRANRKE